MTNRPCIPNSENPDHVAFVLASNFNTAPYAAWQDQFRMALGQALGYTPERTLEYQIDDLCLQAEEAGIVINGDAFGSAAATPDPDFGSQHGFMLGVDFQDPTTSTSWNNYKGDAAFHYDASSMTFLGNASIESGDAPTGLTHAAEFDGTGDLIMVESATANANATTQPHFGDENYNSWAFEFWVKLNALGTYIIAGAYDVTNDGRCWYIQIDQTSGGRLLIVSSGSGTSGTTESESLLYPFAADTWYHVVVGNCEDMDTIGGQTWLTINGDLADKQGGSWSGSDSGFADTEVGIHFGGILTDYTDTGSAIINPLNGKIAGFRIFNGVDVYGMTRALKDRQTLWDWQPWTPTYDPYWDNVELLIDDATITDVSGNGATITNTGVTSVTDVPYRPDGSSSPALYFDGSSYLEITQNAAWDLDADEDFCLEAWVMPEIGVAFNNSCVLYQGDGTGSTWPPSGATDESFTLGISNSARFSGRVSADGTSSGGILSQQATNRQDHFRGRWNHMVFRRIGGQTGFMLNGRSVLPVNNITVNASSENIFVGTTDGTRNMFQGWMCGIRLTVGNARYPSSNDSGINASTYVGRGGYINHTARPPYPTTGPDSTQDEWFPYVRFSTMFDNGSDGPYDESRYGWDAGALDISGTLTGDCEVIGTDSVSGTGNSLNVDRTTVGNSRLTFGNTTEGLFPIDQVDFCAECFIKFPDSAGGDAYIVSQWKQSPSNDDRMWRWYIGTNSQTLQVFNNTVILTTLAGGSMPTPTQGTWHHLAVVRDGNRVRFYFDGVQHANVSASSFRATTSADDTGLEIGAFEGNGPLTEVFRLGGVRLTWGHPRYPAGTTFTPPTAFDSTE